MDIQVCQRCAGYPNAEATALCAAVSRTGLIVPLSAFGDTAYMDSPWELGELADLAAVAKSAATPQ